MLCGMAASFTTNFRRFHSHTATKLQGIPSTVSGEIGSYVSVPMEELLRGVETRSVKIKRPATLRNTYFGLRHGESEANMEGIISSNPVIGTTIHGLTKTGRVQARRAATALIEAIGRQNLKDCVFYSSDFTRARETAEEAIKTMKQIMEYEESPLTHPAAAGGDQNGGDKSSNGSYKSSDLYGATTTFEIVTTLALRERYFGELDAAPLIFYNKVWPVDRVSDVIYDTACTKYSLCTHMYVLHFYYHKLSQIDADNKRYDVESVNEVIARVAAFVK
jgi:bisphosphoglycerate-dependent phosphoglycerate mutase